jgi:hypothetical protein
MQSKLRCRPDYWAHPIETLADKRFTLFGSFVIDVSVIEAVVVNKRLTDAVVSLVLSGNRRTSIKREAATALDILCSFAEFPNVD